MITALIFYITLLLDDYNGHIPTNCNSLQYIHITPLIDDYNVSISSNSNNS